MQASYHKICTHTRYTHAYIYTYIDTDIILKAFNTTHLHIFNNDFARKLKNGQTWHEDWIFISICTANLYSGKCVYIWLWRNFKSYTTTVIIIISEIKIWRHLSLLYVLDSLWILVRFSISRVILTNLIINLMIHLLNKCNINKIVKATLVQRQDPSSKCPVKVPGVKVPGV